MTRLHIDLCCGLGGWQQPFREDDSWRTVGLDIREDLSPDVVADVRELPLRDCEPTLITASPPCTQFTRWDLPWHDEPDPDMSLVTACLEAVEQLDPDWWVLENVRGLHRYWKPANFHAGAFYLWGELPPYDIHANWKGKMQTSGENPEERAKIPYRLAATVKNAVEVWT